MNLAFSKANCQSSVEAFYHYGFLLPHRASMTHLPQEMSSVGEFRLGISGDGSKQWHHIYNHPNIDFTARFFDLGNHEVLGYGVGIAAIFSSPLINHSRFQWFLELGAGPGLVTRPFNYESNYKNNAIGSYINAFILGGTKINYRVSPKIWLSASASFNHFSNASFSLPNLGLNYPVIGGGLKYQWKNNIVDIQKDSIQKQTSLWQWNLLFGIKETYQPRNKKFIALTGSFGRRIGLDRKRSLLLSADVFNNTALMAIAESNNQPKSFLTNTQVGVSANYQLHINKVILFAGAGIYILDDYINDGLFYHGAGIRYFAYKNLGINLSLKTHFFKADYFELGLVHSF